MTCSTNLLQRMSPEKQDMKGKGNVDKDQMKLDLATTRHQEFVAHAHSVAQVDDDIAQEAISSIAQALKEAVEHPQRIPSLAAQSIPGYDGSVSV